MRRVYFGDTASGKTRACINFANKYASKEMTVISNIPDLCTEQAIFTDKNKEDILCRDRVLKRIYKDESMDEFPTFNFSSIELSRAKNIIKYLVSKGEILILDDIDCLLPDILVGKILSCLSADGYMNDCWKHVVVAGYSWNLCQLVEDVFKEVYFLINNAEIPGSHFKDVEDKYFEVVYE